MERIEETNEREERKNREKKREREREMKMKMRKKRGSRKGGEEVAEQRRPTAGKKDYRGISIQMPGLNGSVSFGSICFMCISFIEQSRGEDVYNTWMVFAV